MMDVKVADKVEIKAEVGDIVISPKGNAYVLSYDVHSPNGHSKYIARTIDGFNSGANGHHLTVDDLWDSLRKYDYQLYKYNEYEMVLTKK